MSALAIAREFIAEKATTLKQTLQTNFDPSLPAVRSFLDLVRPKLEYTLQLARKADLVEAVREIAQTELDTAFLDATLKDVLENGDRYKKELKTRPRMLEVYFGIVTDTFVDLYRFQGRDVRAQIADLMSLLQQYDHDRVLRFVLGEEAVERLEQEDERPDLQAAE